MDLYLYNELHGCMARDVPGLLETLTDFPELPGLGDLYDYAIGQGLYIEGDENTDGRWTTWPKGTPTEKTVLAWLDSVVSQLSAEMARKLPHGGRIFGYSSSGSLPLKDGDCIRKSDVVLSSTVSFTNDGESAYIPEMFSIVEKKLSWKAARFVGELKQSVAYSDRDSTIIQLANYIREIFGSQQTRMWAHGFTLCADEFRIWLFDRAGGLGTRLISVHKEPLIFIKAIIGFACMDSGRLGFDPTVRWRPLTEEPDVVYDATIFHSQYQYRPDIPLPYIKIETKDSITQYFDIDVVSPLARRVAIQSRGTAVFAARMWNPDLDSNSTTPPWDYVMKEHWRARPEDTEATILQSTGSDEIIGLPLYHFHQDMGRVSTLVRKDYDTSGVSTVKPPSPPTDPTSSGAATSSTIPESPFSKVMSKAIGRVGGSGGRMVGGVDDNHSHIDAVPDSALLTSGIWSYNDRTKSRLITSPIGTPLRQFKSYTQLLKGVRDAVKGIVSPLHNYLSLVTNWILGYWHLYSQCGYVHRDISINNILLLEDQRFASTGMLIDFDMAVKYDSQTSGAPERTGTFHFMAYEILEGASIHTPLHDLESFLYVLLYIGTCYEKGGNLRNINLHDETLFRRADRRRVSLYNEGALKRSHMLIPRFRRAVLEKLNPDFNKVLGRTMFRLRNVVLSRHDKKLDPNLYVDADPDSEDAEDAPEDLYQPAFTKFISVLDAEIVKLAGK